MKRATLSGPRRTLCISAATLGATVLLAAAAPHALAGKDHCRTIELTGAAGPASADDVELQATDYLGNVLDRSCEVTVQSNECADDLAKRLVGTWGNGAAGGSQLGCGVDQGEQTCGKNLDLGVTDGEVEFVFCKHKYKKGKVKGGNSAIEELAMLGQCPEPPPNGERAERGEFKKFPKIEICCFEAKNEDVLNNPASFNYLDSAHCKGKPLGKTFTAPQRIEISLFDRIDRPSVVGDGVYFEPKLPNNDLDVPVGTSSRQISLDPIGFFQRPSANLSGCRAKLATGTNRLSRALLDQLVRCHKEVMEGNGTADCNTFNAGSDPQDKAGAFGEALRSDIVDDCDGPDVATSGPRFSPSVYGLRGCPEPCDGIDVSVCSAGNTGASCVSDRDCDSVPGAADGKCGDWDSAVDCIRCVQQAAVEAAVAEAYGDPPPGTVVDLDELRCRETLGDALRLAVKTFETETLSCQKKADSAKTALPAEAPLCKNADLKGNRAKAADKIATVIDKQCLGVDLLSLLVCSGAGTSALLADCVLDSAADVNAAMSNTAFPETDTECGNDILETGEQCDGSQDGACPGLCQPDCTCILSCPTRVDVRLRPDAAPGGGSLSSIEQGWTGLDHDGSPATGFSMSWDLTCAAPEPPCGDCTVEGLSSSGPQSQSFTRCLDDLSVPCSTPGGTDPACAGSGACASILGPPVPNLFNATTPLCSVNVLAPGLTGTFNPAAGSAAVSLDTRSITYLGTGVFAPCPVCTGDPTPHDGIAGGICDGGPRDGLACDAQGVHADFANPSTGAALSLDCPPPTAQNISGSGVDIALNVTTGSTSLAFQTPCDPPLSGFSCACAVCSLDPSKPCSSDADCAPSGGTCTSSGLGPARQPNACSDLACSSIGGGKGACGAGGLGDILSFCDGELGADGTPLLGCAVQGDCDSFDGLCGGGNCGNCAISVNRPCFLDPLTSAGTAAPGNPVLAGIGCSAPTSNPAVDAARGLPGAVRVSLDVETQLATD